MKRAMIWVGVAALLTGLANPARSQTLYNHRPETGI